MPIYALLIARDAPLLLMAALFLGCFFAAGTMAVWNPALFNRWCNRDPETGLPSHYEFLPQSLQWLEPDPLHRIQTRGLGLVFMAMSLYILSAIVASVPGWLPSRMQGVKWAAGLLCLFQFLGTWLVGLAHLAFRHSRFVQRLQRKEFLPRTEEEDRQRMNRERTAFVLFFAGELLIALLLAGFAFSA